jgi:hypothetical protein
MAIIHFTLDDFLDVRGDKSHDFAAIEVAENCDGELCGLRPELCLPLDLYTDYVARYGVRPAKMHSHLVTSRSHPGARRYVWAISK